MSVKDISREELLAYTQHLEAALAIYADDEDRYLSEEGGEPYGLVPTEAGIIARQARKNLQIRLQKTELPVTPFS